MRQRAAGPATGVIDSRHYSTRGQDARVLRAADGTARAHGGTERGRGGCPFRVGAQQSQDLPGAAD
eukprot:2709791-Rhodomonas_salina.3